MGLAQFPSFEEGCKNLTVLQRALLCRGGL